MDGQSGMQQSSGKLRSSGSDLGNNWEEPAMDQYQSRGEVLTNFQGHWSIWIFLKTGQRGHWSIRLSIEIHMDQWLPNLSESSGLYRYRSIDGGRVPPDVGLAPSAAWRPPPSPPPCALGPLHPTSLGPPLPEPCKKSQGGGGEEGRRGREGKGLA